MERLGAPGSAWERLGAPGSVWERLGAPGSTWERLGAPGRLGASGSAWERFGAPGCAWERRGAPRNNWERLRPLNPRVASPLHRPSRVAPQCEGYGLGIRVLEATSDPVRLAQPLHAISPPLGGVPATHRDSRKYALFFKSRRRARADRIAVAAASQKTLCDCVVVVGCRRRRFEISIVVVVIDIVNVVVVLRSICIGSWVGGTRPTGCELGLVDPKP